MLLKSCDACMIYGPEDDIQIPARVVSVEDKITLFFDDGGAELSSSRIRIDFYDRYRRNLFSFQRSFFG